MMQSRSFLKTVELNISPTSLACCTVVLPDPIPEANLIFPTDEEGIHEVQRIRQKLASRLFLYIKIIHGTLAKQQVIEAIKILILPAGDLRTCVG